MSIYQAIAAGTIVIVICLFWIATNLQSAINSLDSRFDALEKSLDELKLDFELAEQERKRAGKSWSIEKGYE